MHAASCCIGLCYNCTVCIEMLSYYIDDSIFKDDAVSQHSYHYNGNHHNKKNVIYGTKGEFVEHFCFIWGMKWQFSYVIKKDSMTVIRATIYYLWYLGDTPSITIMYFYINLVVMTLPSHDQWNLLAAKAMYAWVIWTKSVSVYFDHASLIIIVSM